MTPYSLRTRVPRTPPTQHPYAKKVKRERNAKRADIKDISAGRNQYKARVESHLKSSSNTPLLRKTPAKVIALYNFKGGVGKTSNVINLGATLAQTHRVLLVDADPQCNLTSFFAPPPEDDDEGEEDGTEDLDTSDPDDDLAEGPGDHDAAAVFGGAGPSSAGQSSSPAHFELSNNVAPTVITSTLHQDADRDFIPIEVLMSTIYQENRVENLYDLLSEVFVGTTKTPADLLPPSRLVSPVHDREGDFSAFHWETGELLLLQGSPNLLELNFYLEDNTPRREHVYKGAFRKLILATAEAVKADYVLVDLGPSVSALNRNFILSCDYILPPVAADFYSLASAHKLLTVIMKKMLDEHYDLCHPRRYHEPDDVMVKLGYTFNKHKPKLLPFIFTMLDAGATVNHVRKHDSKFIHTLNLVTSPKSEHVPPEVQALYHPANGGCMTLALMKNLGNIQQHAHHLGVPPVSLTKETLANLIGSRRNEEHPSKNLAFARLRYASFCTWLDSLPPRCGPNDH